MDTASVLCLFFVILTAAYIFVTAIFLARGPDKLSTVSLSRNVPKTLNCFVHASVISGALIDTVHQLRNTNIVLDGCPYHRAVVISAAAGSVASLTSIVLRSVDIWQALYAALACVNWTLICIILPDAGKLTYLVPGLYLVALIATLSVPYEPSTWRIDDHPLTKTALLPAVTLSWLDPLLKRAASGVLSPDSLWPVTNGLSVQDTLSKDTSAQPWKLDRGLLWTLARYFSRPLYFSAILALVNLAMTFMQPFLLRSLLQDREQMAVAGLFAASMISGCCEAHMKFRLRMIGLRMRSVLTASLCDRGLCVAGGGKTGAPEPAVLIEVDLPRVFDLVEQAHLIWMVPLQVCISLAALVYILGWKSVVVGSLSPIVLLPILMYVMRQISRLVAQVMEAKDLRVALVTQVLKQVRQIKLAAMQTLFQGKIDQAREHELNKTRNVAVSNASMVCIVYLLPTALIFVCFGSYSYFNGQLTSDVVFPALAFFFNVNRAMALLPRLVMLYQSGVISFDRVRNALSCPEYEKLEPVDAGLETRMARPQVMLHQCSFGVPGSHSLPKLILERCTMDIAPGTLAVISGPVGSGKTTLLRSILGDVVPWTGSVQVQGRVAYASQKPFLINGTVRENILFGSAFDGPFYERVLEAVALRQDLMRLPEGDETVLGGTSVALSGGQMSRVALARAIYSRREVLVLDDPLAAIDGRVRRHIIDNVLGQNGILKNSIRIVTTSAEELMQAADKVFAISRGTISEVSAPVPNPRHAVIERPSQGVDLTANSTAPRVTRSTYGSLKSAATGRIIPTESDVESEEAPLLNKAQPSDDFGAAGVTFSTYSRFLKLSNMGGWPIVLVIAAASKLLDVIGLYCLKLSSEEYETAGHSNKLIYYAVCGLAGAWLSAVFVLAAYFMCVIPASRRIHADLTKGVLGSKFTFFDKTPLGQIISRFTNDINKVDSQVGGGLISMVALSVTAMSSILVIVSTSLLSVVYLVPIGVIYLAIQSHYLHACRQLRRLENAARGPILNMAGEIKTGAAIILSYGQSDGFRQRARSAIDDHIQVWGPFLSLDIWLMLRLQVLSSIIQLLSACLLLAIDSPTSTLGLVMNFVIQITAQFNSLVQCRANLEADITSTERIWTYAANPPEHGEDEVSPPSTWPQVPSIVFDSFTACYEPGGAPCLSDINLVVEPGQHVAVVGRTGAGKSSFTMALLRALDSDAIKSGQIRIDGLDISQLKLATLRKRITLVPQEPAAFDGSLRDNLDPEGARDVRELLEVAEICHVRQIFNMDSDTNLLEYPIRSGSASLSAGQIQVIALARAILAKNKVVILDEAAAAMDAKTRKLINDLIRHKFEECTVISITHHLDSVMNYDRILVLDGGRVLDFDDPNSLLQKRDSIFAQLMREARAPS